MNRKKFSLRSDLAGVEPYVPPQYQAGTRLHANESPLDVPDELRSGITQKLSELNFNRYPDATSARLRKAIGAAFDLTTDNVMVGNGSNEVIQSLLLAYGGAGRSAVTFEPTYTMHGKIARITATGLRSFPLSADFALNIEPVLNDLVASKPDIIFICSPNNPTGNLVDMKAIRQLLETGALVVVDEAYGEFTGQTVVPWLKSHDNLAVVKTFSKALRLAGLRIGYLLAREEIIAEVDKVRLPYNVNAFSQMVAEDVFENRQPILRLVEAIKREREQIYRELQSVEGIKPYPSETNFILFRAERDGNRIWEELLGRGILIRNFSDYPSLANCLRVTIGLPEENNAFIKALKEVL